MIFISRGSGGTCLRMRRRIAERQAGFSPPSSNGHFVTHNVAVWKDGGGSEAAASATSLTRRLEGAGARPGSEVDSSHDEGQPAGRPSHAIRGWLVGVFVRSNIVAGKL